MAKLQWDVPRAAGRVGAMVALALGATMLTGAAGAQDLPKVRVTNFTNTVVLGLYRGIDKGYFKEAGIDLEIVKVATGAASVSAVASNQADIGWAATTVPIFARSNGVPVKAFMIADQEGPPDHFGTFYDASAKSGITSWKDVKGKTVMINAFGTAGEVGVRDRLQKNGMTKDDVKWVTVPFPQMPAALELGNADIVCTIQPMHAAIMANKATGAKIIDTGNLSDSHTKPSAASVYFATDDWISKHQKEALAFGRAFQRAQKEVHDDPKLRLQMVMQIAGMDEATAKTIPEAWFEGAAIKKEHVAPIIDTLTRVGMMPKPVSADDVFVTLAF